MRNLLVSLQIAFVVLHAGCDAQRTRLQLDVPPSARGRITSVYIGVYPAESTVCTDLAFWATGSCGRECSEVPAPLAPETTLSERTLSPDAEGRFGMPEIDAGGGASWEVVIIAQIDGEEPLYGCRNVRAGADVDVALYWPWCSARACDRLFHHACDAQVVCAGEPLLDPFSPSCTVEATSVVVWEEAGVSCAEPASPAGPCRQARILCEEGSTAPEEDGICPRPSDEEMCVTAATSYQSARDIDCDGAHPLCDTLECDPSMDGRRMCGDGTCVGVAICVAGMFSECFFDDVESCNGMDDDCDDATDEGDDLVLDCNRGRRPTAPAANVCRDGACRCGREDACTGSGACCGDACVDITSSPAHCGECGNPCAGDRGCVAGVCVADPAGDAGTPGCTDAASCNLTHQGADGCDLGTCMCGSGPACDLPELCCDGRCVAVSDSVDHCGRCGRVCASCIRGSCR